MSEEIKGKRYHLEKFLVRNGKPVIKILDGFYKWNQYDRQWIKPKVEPTYISVTERGYVKKLRLPVVLREDVAKSQAGLTSATSTFSKIMFTVTVREDKPLVYLIWHKDQRKVYIRNFAHIISTRECGFNNNELVAVKRGRTTTMTRQQAIELTKQGSPFFTGVLSGKEGQLVWISKASV